MDEGTAPPPRRILEQISTHWPLIRDPAQFVLRYAPAIEAYLGALVRDPHAVEEITQDFLLRVVERGLIPEENLRGRFRNYLKAAVRNAALTHFRRRPTLLLDEDALRSLPADAPDPTDDDWLREWRRCLLDRVWESLEQQERRSTGNYAYTALRLTTDHPQADSVELAERTSAAVGRPLRPDAFRKQVSRARRDFARYLLEEVVRTVENPTPERVEEELIEVGLMPFLRPFLPDDWRTQIAAAAASAADA
jgi:RNA polymerase sigma-70 factor (ECF subfamily)